MAVSQVIFNGSDLINLTGDTVTPDKVLNGYTFHGADGNQYIGTAEGGGGGDDYLIKIDNQPYIISAANLFRDQTEFNDKVDIGSAINNCDNTFRNCSSFNQPLNISSNVNNSKYMLYGCISLNSNVNISEGVVDISTLFYGCSNLNQNIAIPSTVVNTSNTFSGCSSLDQNISIPDNVVDVSYMFSGCSSLTQNIHIPEYITNAKGIFSNCSSLNKNIEVSDNIADASYMFYGCSSLDQNMHIPDNATDISYMFGNCSSLNQNIQIPNNIINTYFMFSGCTNLNQNIKIPENVVDISGMFAYCNNMTNNINIPNNVINISHLFDHCTKMGVVPNISNNVINVSYAFSGTQLYMPRFNAYNAIDASGLFYNCRQIVNFYNFNVGNGVIINASHMFDNCVNLFNDYNTYFIQVSFTNTIKDASWMFANTKINISRILTSQYFYNYFYNLENASGMFYGCKYCNNPYGIGNLYFSTRIRDTSYMFANSGCVGTQGQLGGANGSCVINASHMFENCFGINNSYYYPNLQYYNNLEDASYMFANCTRITYGSIIFYNSINIKNTSHMFENCINMYQAYSGFPENVSLEDTSYMFANCYKLPGCTIPLTYKNINVINVSHMFCNCNNISSYSDAMLKIFGQKTSDISYVFYNVINVAKALDYNHIYFDSVINAAYAFSPNPASTKGGVLNYYIYLYNLNKIENIAYMMYNLGRHGNTRFVIDSINVNNVNNMANAFTNAIEFWVDSEHCDFNFRSLTNAAYAFYQTNFCIINNNDNKPTIHFYKDGNFRETFSFSYNFNCKIIFPENVTSIKNCMSFCQNFNETIVMPKNVYDGDISYMFFGCYNFNKPIIIPNNITNAANMFSLCYNFNQPIIMPYTIENACGMFYGCSNLNLGSIRLPESLTYYGTFNMFGKYAHDLNVYVDENIEGLYQLFGSNINRDNNCIINIYCNNISKLNKSQNLLSGAVTWTEMTNGYYNTVYNLYIYNNNPY